MPDLNGNAIIPKWFLAMLSFFVVLLTTGGLPWAWQVSTDIAAIKVKVEVREEGVLRRLDRHEMRLDRIEERGRK